MTAPDTIATNGVSTTTDTPVLAAHGLCKTYRLGGRDIPVLNGIELTVKPRETVALLGSSGAGKSTLLHLLGLLDVPTSGEIHYDGERVDHLSVARRARRRHNNVGFVFQFYHLIPELDALRNVQLGGMMHVGAMSWFSKRRAVRERATELLELVGLGDRLGHRPRELSGGERQRVAIARALIAEPRVILADEPTGNLDSKTASEILDVLFRINRERGIAFVIVTHNEDLAKLCDRTVRLTDGVVQPNA